MYTEISFANIRLCQISKKRMELNNFGFAYKAHSRSTNGKRFLRWRNVIIKRKQMSILTRLHSSRMRTARALTISPSMLCAVGVSAPGRSVCSRGVCSRGVCSWGVYPSMHWGRQPPSVNRILDHTPMKILPCPKLRLRAVNINSFEKSPPWQPLHVCLLFLWHVLFYMCVCL